MKNSTRFLLGISCMALSLLMLSAPSIGQTAAKRMAVQGNGARAASHPVTYTQPDGSQITLHLRGDKVIHWAETTDGYTVLCNVAGTYEYAKKDIAGDLILSGVAAHQPGQRDLNENALLATIPQKLFFSQSQLSEKINAHRSSVKSAKAGFPAIGTQNFLVILMEFSDLTFTYAQTDFDDMMNATGYNGTGSFNDFYYDNSYGKFDVVTTVVGPYTATNTAAYYGGNTPSDDANVGELITEAVNAADADVDYNDFDNDGDGVADAVYVIYAGEGEATSGNPDDIWPHASTITTVTLDGVDITDYACSNETNYGDMSGIGTICHEFGHSLGLPDFYDTDYSGSGGEAEGTGNWDVMAGGNSNGGEQIPANHNAYSKKMLGWLDFTPLTTNQTVTIHNASEDSIVYTFTTPTAGEYFLLENRQFVGFDDSIPGHGMLVYHVDDNYIQAHLANNDLNADPSHQGFDIEEADDDPDPATQSGDAFPGPTANTDLTDGTSPSSLSWAGASCNKEITAITESGSPGVITFEFDVYSAGMNNTAAATGITIMPTVTDRFVNISGVGIKTLNLYSSNGMRLSSFAAINGKCTIDLGGYASGIYFLRAETGMGVSTTSIIRK